MPEAEGLINAFLSFTKSSILVLSPKIEPLVNELLGSTANTATFLPKWVKCVPKASIKVLFPTPGTPVIPIRTDLLACGKHCLIIAFAFSKCCGFVLSTRVIALLNAVISPFKIALTKSSVVGCD